MAQHSLYYRQHASGCYTPETFVTEYNKHTNLNSAAGVMAFDKVRLSVIASRLRKRGYPVKSFSRVKNPSKIGNRHAPQRI